MTTPHLLDVVVLNTDLPEPGLTRGAVGTIVEIYDDGDCEIEFTNDDGETLGLLALLPDQFDVIWSGAEVEQVQTVQQLVAVVRNLQPDQVREVLDFARFLQTRVRVSS